MNIEPRINSWKEQIDGYGPNDLLVKSIEAAERFRDGEEPYTVEIPLHIEFSYAPIAILFFKFPELFEVASNLGWEPVQSNLLEHFIESEIDDYEDESLNFDYTWSLRREIN